MIGCLPTSLTVDGAEYAIRSDYRNVLQCLEAFNDPDLRAADKWLVAMLLMFEEFNTIEDVEAAISGGFNAKDAIEQIQWFIAAGKETKEKDDKKPPSYSWTQDEQMIFSSVNNVAKQEVREVEYMHWWTFLGYFNEIGEGTFSFIVNIRNKLANGKKLEKYEKEFLQKNKDLVLIKKPLTEEEKEQERELQSLVDDVIG